MVIRALAIVLALSACKKVERLPSAPEEAPITAPEPAQPKVVQPVMPSVPRITGCVADKITTLTGNMGEVPDCSVDEAACQQACIGGQASACFSRAAQIQNQRPDDAATLFGRACELGIAIACTNYAAGMWNAGGNEDCARRVFEKACAVKEPYACGMLGRMAVTAAKDDASKAAARALLQKTCDELGGPPCKMLADALKAGSLGAFEQNQILPLLKKACEGGDGMACEEIQGGAN